MLNSLGNDRVIKYNLDMLLCARVSLHYVSLVPRILTFVSSYRGNPVLIFGLKSVIRLNKKLLL